MIITLQTPYGSALLLLSSLLAGIILSLVYVIFVSLPAIVIACKCTNGGYKTFSDRVRSYQSNKVIKAVSDFLICFLAACSICVCAFIFNSGQLRFSAAAALCLGYLIGKTLFQGLAISIITAISYAIAKVMRIVGYPFAVLVKLCFGLFRKVIHKATVRRRIAVIKKYTQDRFDKLEKLTEFGLVDQYYKDLIK